jgi:O-antigen/teichoic acid export membrane protein
MAEMFGYYTLLDLGIRSAVSYYVAMYHAKDDALSLRQSVASAVWTLAAAGTLITIAASATVLLVPGWFAQSVDAAELVPAILIMAATVGASLPMEALTSVLVGHQRFDIVNAIDVSLRIPTAIAIVLALYSGGGLIEMSMIQACAKVVGWTAMFFAVRRVVPAVSLNPKWVSKASLRSLTHIGSRNVIGNIAVLANNRSSLIIIGLFVGAEAVTFFTIARLLVDYTSTANFNVTRAFTPQLTNLFTRSDHSGLRETLYKGTRLSGLLVVVFVAGLLAFGTYFIRLWISPSYVTGHWTMRTDIVLSILVLGQFPRYFQSMSWQLLYASGKVGYAMWMSLLQAALTLILSITLVQKFGIAGVALGAAFPTALCYIVLIPTYVRKRFDIPFREYITKGVGRPLIIGGILVVFTQLLVRIAPPFTWMMLIAEVAATCAVAAVLVYLIGLTADERERIMNFRRKVSQIAA